MDLVEKCGLVHPQCIACDDEDNINCNEIDNNKILTCDGSGDYLRIHEVELERNSRGRTALAITDQKLFVAERGSPDNKVYNKQLQYLSIFKHRDMYIKDISVDIHQNLYVSDKNNSCVHDFTKYGVLLRTIGHDKEELKKP